MCCHTFPIRTDKALTRVDAMAEETECGALVELREHIFSSIAEECRVRCLRKTWSEDVRKNLDAVIKEDGTRFDEDLRDHVVETGNGGEGVSARSVLRSIGVTHVTNADKWHELRLQEFVAAGHLSFANARSFHVAGDGNRFGMPAEEVLQLALWSSDNDLGIMLPCQATHWR